MLLLLSSLASAARIVVLTYNPVVIWVDGRIVESPDVGNQIVAEGLNPGRHLIEARTALGRPLASTSVSLTDRSSDANFYYEDGSFSPYDAGRPPTGPGWNSSVGVIVPGGGGLVVVTGGSTGNYPGTSEPPTPPTPLPPPPPPRTAPVNVEFLSTDGEWSNVYIDGEKVAEFRNSRKLTTTLVPGIHAIEVRDFMENEVWYKGKIHVDGSVDPLKIGITKGTKPEVYNDPNALR
ncbi:MAG TPA: hypothetical protein PLA94_19455 [Myxococcota bacterium]|nr:hypothetical protein [Myxococcota bacterium]